MTNTADRSDAGSDVDVPALVKQVPEELRAAVLTARKTSPRSRVLTLDREAVTYPDAYALRGLGLVEARGSYGTAPFVLTPLGERVQEALAALQQTDDDATGPGAHA